MSRKMNSFRQLCVAAGALIALGIPSASSAAIKCWVNKEGVKECGNAVPPEYAQQEHTVKSKAGLTVKKKLRAKSKDELRKEKADAERHAKAKAKKDRIAREKSLRDRVLLQTYTTEEDMLMARDGQLDAIDTRIKHTQQQNTKLEKTLRGYQEEAAKLERSGKSLTDQLKKNISNVKGRVRNNRNSVTAKKREKTDLIAKFKSDLARYRQLKGN